MHRDRFDQLARSYARSTSRRSVLKALAGAFFGSVAVTAGAEAAPRPPSGSGGCLRSGHTCTVATADQCCSGQCISGRCGTCKQAGTRCSAGTDCCSGTCTNHVCACTTGSWCGHSCCNTVCCRGVCCPAGVTTCNSDGSCGPACGSPQHICSDGSCQDCCTDADCGIGLYCQNGTCGAACSDCDPSTDSGCTLQNCYSGSVCQDGTCTDDCGGLGPCPDGYYCSIDPQPAHVKTPLCCPNGTYNCNAQCISNWYGCDVHATS